MKTERRARRWFRPSLAGALLATAGMGVVSACSGDAAPADDALVANLSNREVLALCDELRDGVTADDRPIQCAAGERYWVLPSDQLCLELPRSTCDATVGELRRCHAQALQDLCAEPVAIDSVSGAGDDCQLSEGCSYLMPHTARAGAPDCTPIGLSELRALDGVYELSSASGPFMASASASDEECLADFPRAIEPGVGYVVLASSDLSGTPEVIIQGCDSIDECQALARALPAGGSTPDPSLPGAASNRFVACEEQQFEGSPLRLQSALPDVPLCSIEWAPRVRIDIEPGRLGVNIAGPVEPAEASRGCGSVTVGWSCSTATMYRTTLAAPL